MITSTLTTIHNTPLLSPHAVMSIAAKMSINMAAKITNQRLLVFSAYQPISSSSSRGSEGAETETGREAEVEKTAVVSNRYQLKRHAAPVCSRMCSSVVEAACIRIFLLLFCICMYTKRKKRGRFDPFARAHCCSGRRGSMSSHALLLPPLPPRVLCKASIVGSECCKSNMHTNVVVAAEAAIGGVAAAAVTSAVVTYS